jgi:hypothetical protein
MKMKVVPVSTIPTVVDSGISTVPDGLVDIPKFLCWGSHRTGAVQPHESVDVLKFSKHAC